MTTDRSGENTSPSHERSFELDWTNGVYAGTTLESLARQNHKLKQQLSTVTAERDRERDVAAVKVREVGQLIDRCMALNAELSAARAANGELRSACQNAIAALAGVELGMGMEPGAIRNLPSIQHIAAVIATSALPALPAGECQGGLFNKLLAAAKDAASEAGMHWLEAQLRLGKVVIEVEQALAAQGGGRGNG